MRQNKWSQKMTWIRTVWRGFGRKFGAKLVWFSHKPWFEFPSKTLSKCSVSVLFCDFFRLHLIFCCPGDAIVDFRALRKKYEDNEEFKALVERLIPYLFQNDVWDPMKAKEWNVAKEYYTWSQSQSTSEYYKMDSVCTAERGCESHMIVIYLVGVI